MTKHIVGIDPGKSGAIVWMNPETKVISKKVTPVIGKSIDIHELNKHFKFIKTQLENPDVFIEEVHAIHNSAAGATFTFGGIYYLVQGLCVAHELPYTLVQPKIWQKELYQGIPEIRKPSITVKTGKHQGQKRKGPRDTKAMSLLAAKRLFPWVDLKASDRCKNPHDGIVDALLICEFGRRILCNNK